MKKTIVFVVVFLTSISSLHAGIYLRAGTFFSSVDDVKVQGEMNFSSAVDDSFGFTGAVGYKFSVIRLEGEFNYLDSNIKKINLADFRSSGDYKKSNLFVNALIELPIIPMFSPYAGIGFGITDIEVDVRNIAINGDVSNSFRTSGDESLYSAQFMAGLRFSLMKTFSVYAGYRYIITEGFTVKDNAYSLKTDNGQHMVEVGLGLGF